MRVQLLALDPEVLYRKFGLKCHQMHGCGCLIRRLALQIPHALDRCALHVMWYHIRLAMVSLAMKHAIHVSYWMLHPMAHVGCVMVRHVL